MRRMRGVGVIPLLAVAIALLGLADIRDAAEAQGAPPRRYPARLLGVYDMMSGLPIEDAEVVDMLTGTKAMTSSTGTITLAWLPEGLTLLRIRKLGFEVTTLPVVISPVDTAGITVLLTPVGQMLPAVEVVGAADTVRKLVANGFYTRRQRSGAPPEAFISGAQLAKLTSLSDVRSLSGRALCVSNLFIDGIRVSDSASTPAPPTPTTRRARAGRDSLPAMPVGRGGLRSTDISVPIEMVVGIETYRASEIPPQFAAPTRPGVNSGCATLIWTR